MNTFSSNTFEFGPLEFSAGNHQIVEGRDIEIGDESESAIQKRLRVTDFKHVIESYKPFPKIHNGHRLTLFRFLN